MDIDIIILAYMILAGQSNNGYLYIKDAENTVAACTQGWYLNSLNLNMKNS